jgi:hypothetical protein
VIIGEYSPGRSRGEYSPIITEPEAEVNNCFSIFTQVVCVSWDWIYFISLTSSLIASTEWLAAILKISPVGEYNSLIRQIWPINLGFVILTCAKILRYNEQ